MVGVVRLFATASTLIMALI